MNMSGYAPMLNVLQQPQVGLQSGLMNPQPQVQGLPSQVMGPWSQLAYQMAGSPHQGGALPSVAAPTAIPGSLTDPGSSSGGGTGTAILTGLLGAVAKNPGLVKSAYSGISGLLGSGSGASVLAGGSPALSAIGTGAVAPAANAAAADAASALAGTPSAATGGLLGAGSAAAASGAGSALGAGAPGVFATGNAAAGSAGGAGAASGSLGLAGAAIPLAAAALPFLIGMSATQKTDQGNVASQAWQKATGGKWVGTATATGNSQFGLTQTQQKGGVDTGYYLMPDGSHLTKAQASNAIYQWAQQNGVNPGDYHP